MNASSRGRPAILGIGQSPLGKTGHSSLELHAISAMNALEDAGVSRDQVDGLLTPYSMMDNNIMFSTVLAEYMGIQPSWCVTATVGGATPFALLPQAVNAVKAGFVDTVLVVSADNRASGLSREEMTSRMAGIAHPRYEEPYFPPVPSLYALAAQRHMYEYGTTSEQLATIAVTLREHATLNDAAVMRDPLTIDDVMDSRMISSPLRKFDCCLVTDYGGAYVVTSSRVAADSPAEPIYLLGYGEGHRHQHVSQAESLTTVGSHDSGRRAFSQAGLKPSDVDVAELYDSFTITLLIELEDLGFCAKGEGGAFVEDGNISLSGTLPVNTHGGMLSCSTGGVLHLLEAVRQLRGEAGSRQVRGAEVALAHGDGGALSAHCTALLGKQATIE